MSTYDLLILLVLRSLLYLNRLVFSCRSIERVLKTTPPVFIKHGDIIGNLGRGSQRLSEHLHLRRLGSFFVVFDRGLVPLRRSYRCDAHGVSPDAIDGAALNSLVRRFAAH